MNRTEKASREESGSLEAIGPEPLAEAGMTGRIEHYPVIPAGVRETSDHGIRRMKS